MKKQKKTSEIKKKARRTLKSDFQKIKQNYVVDTSAIINKFIPKLIRNGLKGKIIIPHVVMAELENMANKGREEGFIGLEEVAGLHKLKKQFPIQVYFYGARPTEMQIKFAKSGEMDAAIREIAIKEKALLITADLVQAKTSQAYGLKVVFLRVKQQEKPKKRFLSFFKKR
jgi:ATPase